MSLLLKERFRKVLNDFTSLERSFILKCFCEELGLEFTENKDSLRVKFSEDNYYISHEGPYVWFNGKPYPNLRLAKIAKRKHHLSVKANSGKVK